MLYAIALGAIAALALSALEDSGEQVSALFEPVVEQLRPNADQSASAPFTFVTVAPPARVGETARLSGTAASGAVVELSGPGIPTGARTTTDDQGDWAYTTMALMNEGGAVFSAEQAGVGGSAETIRIVVPGCGTLPETPPTPPTRCDDGDVYLGVAHPGQHLLMAACDAGQTWAGGSCVGIGAATLVLEYGPPGARQTYMESVVIDTSDQDPANDRLLLSFNNGNISGSGLTSVPASRSLSDGQANTLQHVERQDAGAPYLAAVFCDNLVAHGADDWYLPALNEQGLIFTVGNFDTGDGAAYGLETVFAYHSGQDLTAGRFGSYPNPGNAQNTPSSLWSSTEMTGDDHRLAWSRQMNAYPQNTAHKGTGLAVRCVRRITE